VTPLRGLFAVAIALIVSGVIGFFLLNGPRDEASVSLSRVFGRINDRIEAGNRAEDERAGDATVITATGMEVLAGGSAELRGQDEPDAEENPVGQGEDSGELENGNEGPAAGTFSDDEGGAHREGQG